MNRSKFHKTYSNGTVTHVAIGQNISSCLCQSDPGTFRIIIGRILQGP